MRGKMTSYQLSFIRGIKMNDDLDFRSNLIAMIAERLDDYPTEDIAQIYEDFCLQTLH